MTESDDEAAAALFDAHACDEVLLSDRGEPYFQTYATIVNDSVMMLLANLSNVHVYKAMLKGMMVYVVGVDETNPMAELIRSQIEGDDPVVQFRPIFLLATHEVHNALVLTVPGGGKKRMTSEGWRDVPEPNE